MSVTYGRGRKLLVSIREKKLLRMLQSTSQKFPGAKLIKKRGAFGVCTDGPISLYIRYSGELSPTDLRDLLVLFATWVTVDPECLGLEDTSLDGS